MLFRLQRYGKYLIYANIYAFFYVLPCFSWSFLYSKSLGKLLRFVYLVYFADIHHSVVNRHVGFENFRLTKREIEVNKREFIAFLLHDFVHLVKDNWIENLQAREGQLIKSKWREANLARCNIRPSAKTRRQTLRPLRFSAILTRP